MLDEGGGHLAISEFQLFDSKSHTENPGLMIAVILPDPQSKHTQLKVNNLPTEPALPSAPIMMQCGNVAVKVEVDAGRRWCRWGWARGHYERCWPKAAVAVDTGTNGEGMKVVGRGQRTGCWRRPGGEIMNDVG